MQDRSPPERPTQDHASHDVAGAPDGHAASTSFTSAGALPPVATAGAAGGDAGASPSDRAFAASARHDHKAAGAHGGGLAARRKALAELLGVHVADNTAAEEHAHHEAAADQRHFDREFERTSHGRATQVVERGQPVAAWTLSHTLAGAEALEEDGAPDKPQVQQLIAHLKAYREGGGYAPLPSGGAQWDDDNEWLGLDLMTQYAISGTAQYLAMAEQTCSFVMAHVEHKSDAEHRGGIEETVGKRGESTVSNAPAAQLAALLYMATGRRSYLEFALKIERFLDNPKHELYDAKDGLFNDNNGTNANPTVKDSYSEGTPIGMEVLLYKATHDPSHLAKAQAIAQAALPRFEHPTDMKLDVIYYRNLLLLARVAYDPAYVAAFDGYMQAVDRGHGDEKGSAMQQSVLVELRALQQQYAALGAAQPEAASASDRAFAPAAR